MRDVVVLAVIALFFVLCVAYVRWCDHIIGPDPDDLHDDGDAAAGAEQEPVVVEAVRS